MTDTARKIAERLPRLNWRLGGVLVTDTDEAEAIVNHAIARARAEALEEAAKVADEYPQRDPAEDGSGYWAAEEIAAAIRALGGGTTATEQMEPEE